MSKSIRAFTIVELMIVIVVIAIIAAIVFVAYNGIQARANTSVIKSDLATIAKKIMLYQADNGSYPAGATSGAVKTALSTIDFRLSLGSYSTATNTNLLYITVANGSQYALLARATGSTETYYITESISSPTLYGGTGGNAYPGGSPANVATYLGIVSPVTTYGYNASAVPPGFQFWY